ncbi:hypothetical protein OFN54_31660, partial [Escherichia coli]|nr:hypothetical protein [Escherichia coli]
ELWFFTLVKKQRHVMLGIRVANDTTVMQELWRYLLIFIMLWQNQAQPLFTNSLTVKQTFVGNISHDTNIDVPLRYGVENRLIWRGF